MKHQGKRSGLRVVNGRMRHILFTALLPLIPLAAGATQITVQVDGLACPFCVYGIEKKLMNVSGVNDVEIDLDSGLAVLTGMEGKIPLQSDIRKAVERAGFAPGAITISVAGTISLEGQISRLNTSDPQRDFLLLPTNTGNSDESLTGTQVRLAKFAVEKKRVLVTGTWRENDDGEQQLFIEEVKEIPAQAPVETR